MSFSLEEAIARIPGWAGLQGLETCVLAGGITNRNVRVNVNGESFVLRLGCENTELLGIDRMHECAAHGAAAALGIAPEVIWALSSEGLLVTRFIDGRALPEGEMKRPENIRRVAEVLREVHHMPEIPGSFSPFRTVRNYATVAQRYGARAPAACDRALAAVNQIEAALLKKPFEPRPCHNDLLNGNFLDDGRIRILDWEYAGMGDPVFDLANFAANHGFDGDQERTLLQCYFGSVTRAGLARLRLLGIMSGLREAMWGVVQSGISRLDFDFCAYAESHFARVTERIADTRFGTWLEEAAGDD